MILSGHYVGCPIYIYNNQGETLASTTILTHNKEQLSVSIPLESSMEWARGFVTVLIVTNNCVHEYKGQFRHMFSGSRTAEIALFKGTVKENRSNKRYAVNTSAFVEHVTLHDKQLFLSDPVQVLVVNLSVSGLLLQSPPNYFTPDSILDLKLDMIDDFTRLRSQIVWGKNISPTCSEYGCKFV